MAKIDPLLQILLKQGGDQLQLSAGQAPRFSRVSAPLKLFFPPLDELTILEMIREVFPGETPLMPEERLKAQCEYLHALGVFKVMIDWAPQLTARFELRAHASSRDDAIARRAADHSSPPRVLDDSPMNQRPSQETPDLEHIPQTRIKEDQVKISSELQPKHVMTPTKVTHEVLVMLLEMAVEMRASDLHLSAHEQPVVRVDGALVSLPWGRPIQVKAALESLLTQEERVCVDAGGSIDRGVDLDHEIRLRLNIYLHSGGWGAAIRLIRKTPPPLSSLGLSLPWSSITRDPHGLLLVCGPTGSGKSTTLAALTQLILRERGGVLITLEDPIEYHFSVERGVLIRQRELGLHVSSFAGGLRAALREDPDIILIGEMRDPETIQLALTAAETGHLVLSSLHSRSASSAIERMIDSIPSEGQAQVRMQLAEALRGVIAQRLIPKRHGEGRVAAVEYLRVTHSVASMIRDSKTSQITSAIQAGGDEGMILLERSLAQLVDRGVIRHQDGEAAANQLPTYQQYISHHGSSHHR